MTEKKYNYAGIAVTRWGPKVRFTNNLTTRIKRLAEDSPEFMQLPNPMTKLDAANWLLTNAKVVEDPKSVIAIQKVVSRFTKATKPAAEKKAPAKAEKPATTKAKPAATKAGAVRKGKPKLEGASSPAAEGPASPVAEASTSIEV